MHIFRKQGVHVIAYAISKVVADGAHTFQPDEQGVAVVGGELVGDMESLFEHADQRIEIDFILIADIVRRVF